MISSRRDYSTQDASARPAFMRCQGWGPFPPPLCGSVSEACSLCVCMCVYLSQICPISTSQTDSNTGVTITAGKWKVLWGKQTPLIHIAAWSTRWTQMSENIDSDGRLGFFSVMSWLGDFRLAFIEKRNVPPRANSLWKIMALVNWIISLIIGHWPK